MTEEQYGYVYDAYERLTGEPLVADGEYVTPFWDSTWVAVNIDPSCEPLCVEDMVVETAQRVAAMINIQTHGFPS